MTYMGDVVHEIQVLGTVRGVQVLHLSPHYVQGLPMCNREGFADVPIPRF